MCFVTIVGITGDQGKMMPSTEQNRPLSDEQPTTTPDNKNTTAENADATPREIGGPRGLEPTRYGDWERNGRCTDF